MVASWRVFYALGIDQRYSLDVGQIFDQNIQPYKRPKVEPVQSSNSKSGAIVIYDFDDNYSLTGTEGVS